jgi:inositol polyphosphate-4-phosphatase
MFHFDKEYFSFRLLNSLKDSPAKPDIMSHKIHCANEAVQAIKKLRKEIVDIMVQLLLLAKNKNPKGMLPLTNQMITKSKMLLNIWDPELVEETFAFVELNRIIDDPDNSLDNASMSPFKKITQQLKSLDLKSPELEDFSTPMGPTPDLWPLNSPATMLYSKTKSPSSTDINAIGNMRNTAALFSRNQNNQNEYLSQSLPVTCNKFSETHFDINGEISSSAFKTELQAEKVDQVAASHENNNNSGNEAFIHYDENGQLIDVGASALGKNGAFLDTKVPTLNHKIV